MARATRNDRACPLHALLCEWFPDVVWVQIDDKKIYSTRTNLLEVRVGPLRVYLNAMETVYIVARTPEGAFIEAHSENQREKTKCQIELLLQGQLERNRK
jgi:hypothetical protein